MEEFAGIIDFHEESIPGHYGYQLLKSLQNTPLEQGMLWQRKNAFLGHLSFWSEPSRYKGGMPYENKESELVITGQINLTNRRDLFRLLRIERSLWEHIHDGELILLLYKKYEGEIVNLVQGSFSFVIYDLKEQRLFAARDGTSNKSLFYYYDSHRFAWCSRIEPLFTLPYISKIQYEEYDVVNRTGMTLDTFITPFSNIYQLPPSYSFVISRQKININETQSASRRLLRKERRRMKKRIG